MGHARKTFWISSLCFAIFCDRAAGGHANPAGIARFADSLRFVDADGGRSTMRHAHGENRASHTSASRFAFAHAGAARGPAPAAPPTGTPAGIAATVVALAVLVTTFLQGIKTIFPSIGGYGAQIIAVLLAIAGAISTAPAGQPPLATAGVAITAALGSMGIHGLFKTASGSGNAPAAH